MSMHRSIDWVYEYVKDSLQESDSGIKLTCFSEELDGQRKEKLFETDTTNARARDIFMNC